MGPDDDEYIGYVLSDVARLIRTVFDRRVRDSCLSDVDTYIHQITPFTNPSWDANKFAVEASLQLFARARLGVSLYGEPTYGVTFFDWYERSKHKTYGVTEFHPLRPMRLDEARAMFDAFRKVFGDRVTAHPIEHTRAVEQSNRFLSSIYEIDYRDMTRETWRRARATTRPAWRSRWRCRRRGPRAAPGRSC